MQSPSIYIRLCVHVASRSQTTDIKEGELRETAGTCTIELVVQKNENEQGERSYIILESQFSPMVSDSRGHNCDSRMHSHVSQLQFHRQSEAFSVESARRPALSNISM